MCKTTLKIHEGRTDSRVETKQTSYDTHEETSFSLALQWVQFRQQKVDVKPQFLIEFLRIFSRKRLSF